jgi:hypothetical protein
MRRLIVHIGGPKAGSSSLQSFLFGNREGLARKGILYPVIEGDEARSHSGLPKSFTGQVVTAKQAGMTFPAMQRIISGSSAEAVIISSEFFVSGHRHPAMIEAVQTLARATGLSLTIAAFIRPQHSWINSAFTQSTKRLKNSLDFNPFFESSLARANYNPMQVFKAWMNLPGSEFIALPFTPSQLKPNMETVFLKAAGLANELSDVLDDVVPVIANRSPGPMTIEACLRAAREIMRSGRNTWQAKKHASKFIAWAANEHGWNATSYSGLTNDAKASIWRHFAKANNQFAHKAWGRSWDEVFAEDLQKDVVPNEFKRDLCTDEEYALLNATVEEAQRA